jgi:hypothetical protein
VGNGNVIGIRKWELFECGRWNAECGKGIGQSVMNAEGGMRKKRKAWHIGLRDWLVISEADRVD